MLCMRLQHRIPDFLPSRNGFPFPNAYPEGNPVILAESPFGDLRAGDASKGLCGGMILTTIDLYLFGIREIPAEPTPEVFRYFCLRLMASWNLPFGGLKYYDWQVRPDASRFLGGVRVRPGVSYLTITDEWPKIRQSLDAGLPTAVGLSKVRGWNPLKLGENHQVLAYGYTLDEESGELALDLYDPNYPGDDECQIRVNLHEPDIGRPVTHTWEGPSVRGFFFTEYRRPVAPPPFARAT
jgi:hypothetical protein